MRIKVGRKSITLRPFLAFLNVFLVIALSGPVYFTQVYRMATTIAFLLSSIMLAKDTRRIINREKFSIFLVFALVLAFNFFVNSNMLTKANFIDYVLIVVQLLALAISASQITKEEYTDNYIVIMAIIALTSLVCFATSKFYPDLIDQIASTSIRPGYTISWFHTWGWHYIFDRNAGPFWEPGGYQGYLVLAVLFLFNKGNLRENWKLLLLFVITILTTQSTTGYLLLASLLLYGLSLYLKENKMSSRNKISLVLGAVLLVIIIVAVVQYTLDSSVISGKLDENNESFQIRMKDLTMGMKLVMERPLLGFGIMSPELELVAISFGMRNGNSVGLFAWLSYMGVLFGSAYIGFQVFRIKQFLSNLNFLLLLVVYFILMMTEGLFTFPVYIAFCFYTSNTMSIRNQNI